MGSRTDRPLRAPVGRAVSTLRRRSYTCVQVWSAGDTFLDLPARSGVIECRSGICPAKKRSARCSVREGFDGATTVALRARAYERATGVKQVLGVEEV